jgi:poly(3-hydroxybutyrate) depolymerase
MNHRFRRSVLLAAVVVTLPGLFGCPVIVRNDRGQILRRKEPVSDQTYELFVPSNYHSGKAWPLIVTCHGTPPFDSASLQVREWADLAEHRGLIVAAPVLRGTKARGDAKPATVEQQIEMQRYDEETILATINHVKAGYRIDEGQVFLTGWSAGSYAVLWTGLSHPEIFRALAVRQGNFNAKFIAPLESKLNIEQQVMVFYGQIDLLRSQAEECIRWLKGHGVAVFSDEIMGAHRRDPGLAYLFFEGISRGEPWLVVRWEPSWAGNPLTVRLWARTDPAAQRIEWDLGDGQKGEGASLTHTYRAGGTYDLTVRATFAKKRQVERHLRIAVAPAAGRAAASAPGKP